jgi:tRNA U34 5-carboxymethylaminomethyl modifying enzyme MnmG/GidA
MWGSAIIGFGMYHYKSERSSQEGDWPLTGFSPRKANLTLYLMYGFTENSDLLNKLGKHKTSNACLYINKLSEVDIKVLGELIKKSYNQMKSVNTKNETKSDLPQKLGAPADRALSNAGIKKLNDLTKHTFKEISNLHGIGPNALKKLETELKAKGLSFKQ